MSRLCSAGAELLDLRRSNTRVPEDRCPEVPQPRLRWRAPRSPGAARPGMSILASGDDYEGYVVIDTLVDDRSAGGVRIADDLPLDEVRELAGEMSLKYALFLLPRGGAKSGIAHGRRIWIPERRNAALEDFGRKLGADHRQRDLQPRHGHELRPGPAAGDLPRRGDRTRTRSPTPPGSRRWGSSTRFARSPTRWGSRPAREALHRRIRERGPAPR